jgi:hypothetical protein
MKAKLAAPLATLMILLGVQSAIAEDPLASWNNGAAKSAIISFVEKTTKQGSKDFVPISERIATFDNDGTLWCEKPVYSQFLFAIDRVKALAPKHPEWKQEEPFKSVLDGNIDAVLEQGPKGVMDILAATHSGMTPEEFEAIVSAWIKTAKHPRFDCLCTQLVYQPMVELLALLRSNGFKTYIVSGGGVDFMRPWTEQAYGVPPEQVIGSSIKTAFQFRNGEAVLMRLPQIDYIDDKEGKPINIEKFIGKRPIAAFGNSDGDLPMLQWTAAGSGARFMLLVHHTDAEREWSYDRNSKVGHLDKALDEATKRRWIVVDMKTDWKRIFAFDK